MSVSPFSMYFDHDSINGYFVSIRYNTMVDRENPYKYRLTLMWIDENGIQLTQQVDNMIDVELNNDHRIISLGVDYIW